MLFTYNRPIPGKGLMHHRFDSTLAKFGGDHAEIEERYSMGRREYDREWFVRNEDDNTVPGQDPFVSTLLAFRRYDEYINAK